MVFLFAKFLLKDLQKSLSFIKSYLLLDLFFILSSILVYKIYGVSTNTLINILLLLYLLVISITDFKYQIIPNKMTYLYVIIGIIMYLISENLQIKNAMLGMIVGFLLFLTISIVVTKLLNKPAMGGGDIKLATMHGIFVGWNGVIISLFFASVIALIVVVIFSFLYKKKINNVSFNPFLVFSAILYLNNIEAITKFYFKFLLF